jgi:spore maturation protein CgeB
MINETILLLTPFEDCGGHRLARYIGYLKISVPFDECIYQPLNKLFSKVILYDYLKRMIEIGISPMNQEVIELVKRERPHYVFWVAFGEYYEIKEFTFLAIRQAGSKIVAWFFDDEVRFNFYSRWWTPYIDYFITNDREAVAKYRKLGVWVTHAIPDTGEAVSCDWLRIEEKYEVSFVGSLRADRAEYIAAIKKRAIPISLFGLTSGKFVSYTEMAEIFRTSKINLNFSRTYSYMKFGVKGRIFKVCLAGGFLLTEYFPGLEDYFEIGKEIDCFHDKEEMIEKIRYYLDHDDERRAIARAGWEKACLKHTASHTVARVFAEIEQAERQPLPVTTTEAALPKAVRKRVAHYYKVIAMACLWGNHKGLWRDAFRLSMDYNRHDIGTRLRSLLGSLPPWLRLPIITVEIVVNRLFQMLLVGLGHVPYLRRIKQGLTSRLFRERNNS